MNDNIKHRLNTLRKQFDVEGGMDSIEREWTEEYHYKEYLSGKLANRLAVTMIRIYDDNSEELPICMIHLGEGHVVTCYSGEDRISEEMT
jgi:hypothetical protein